MANVPVRVYSARVDNAELMQMVARVARASVAHIRSAPHRADFPELLHTFVRNCTQYRAERGDQFIRTPRAFVRDRVGDCKTTAVFIAAMCKRQGHRVSLRYIITDGNAHYSHVYPIVDGVAVDPLLEFGKEARYIWHHDEPV